MGTVGLAPGLSRKLKKVLECRTDSPEVVASLNTLSTFYTENTPQARRNLRSTIEKRSLQINLDFLRASQAAQLALDRVEDEVNSLADCCDRYVRSFSSFFDLQFSRLISRSAIFQLHWFLNSLSNLTGLQRHWTVAALAPLILSVPPKGWSRSSTLPLKSRR